MNDQTTHHNTKPTHLSTKLLFTTASSPSNLPQPQKPQPPTPSHPQPRIRNLTPTTSHPQFQTQNPRIPSTLFNMSSAMAQLEARLPNAVAELAALDNTTVKTRILEAVTQPEAAAKGITYVKNGDSVLGKAFKEAIEKYMKKWEEDIEEWTKERGQNVAAVEDVKK